MSDRSVGRHTEDCLKIDLRAVSAANRQVQAFNHHDEITEQLQFAKKLRLAAEDYLSDEHGELVLIPRPDEIEVVYEDLLELNERGKPTKKTDSLYYLLERAEKGGINPLKTTWKHVDIRQFALNAIGTVDTVLDKFAKVEGLYQKDRENDFNFKLVFQDILITHLFSVIASLRGLGEITPVADIAELYINNEPEALRPKLLEAKTRIIESAARLLED